MKMTQFAFGCILLLLCAGMFLLLKSEMDDKHQEMMKELKEEIKDITDARQSAPAHDPAPPVSQPSAPVSQLPPVAPVGLTPTKAGTVSDTNPQSDVSPAPASPAAIANRNVDAIIAKEQAILAERKAATEKKQQLDYQASLNAPAISEEKLSPLQASIARCAAIARISDAREDAASQGFVVLDRGSDVNLEKNQVYAIRRGTAIIGKLQISDTIQATQCIANVIEVVPGMSLKAGDAAIDYSMPVAGPRGVPPDEGLTQSSAILNSPPTDPNLVIDRDVRAIDVANPLPGEPGSPLLPLPQKDNE